MVMMIIVMMMMMMIIIIIIIITIIICTSVSSKFHSGLHPENYIYFLKSEHLLHTQS